MVVRGWWQRWCHNVSEAAAHQAWCCWEDERTDRTAHRKHMKVTIIAKRSALIGVCAAKWLPWYMLPRPLVFASSPSLCSSPLSSRQPGRKHRVANSQTFESDAFDPQWLGKDLGGFPLISYWQLNNRHQYNFIALVSRVCWRRNNISRLATNSLAG